MVKQILDFAREISLTLDCDLIVHQRYCIREIIPQDFFLTNWSQFTDGVTAGYCVKTALNSSSV